MFLLQAIPQAAGEEAFLPLILRVMGIGLPAFLIGVWFLWRLFRSLAREGDPEAGFFERPVSSLVALILVMLALTAVLVWIAQPG